MCFTPSIILTAADPRRPNPGGVSTLMTSGSPVTLSGTQDPLTRAGAQQAIPGTRFADDVVVYLVPLALCVAAVLKKVK